MQQLLEGGQQATDQASPAENSSDAREAEGGSSAAVRQRSAVSATGTSASEQALSSTAHLSSQQLLQGVETQAASPPKQSVSAARFPATAPAVLASPPAPPAALARGGPKDNGLRSPALPLPTGALPAATVTPSPTPSASPAMRAAAATAAVAASLLAEKDALLPMRAAVGSVGSRPGEALVAEGELQGGLLRAGGAPGEGRAERRPEERSSSSSSSGLSLVQMDAAAGDVSAAAVAVGALPDALRKVRGLLRTRVEEDRREARQLLGRVSAAAQQNQVLGLCLFGQSAEVGHNPSE